MNEETSKNEELSEITNDSTDTSISTKMLPKGKKIPKLKAKEVEIVKCKKCSNPLLYNKFRNTYICMQCNLSYNFN